MSIPEMHFGHNCAEFDPGTGRCRVLDARYAGQKFKFLITQKWVPLKGLSETLKVPQAEIQRKIKSGVLKSRVIKRKTVEDEVQVLVDTLDPFDLCPLGTTGGICGDFTPHGRAKIRSISELVDTPPLWRAAKS